MCPYVNICICITPGSHIDDERIAKDIAIAEYIWHPILFKIENVNVLDEPYRFYDGEISYVSSLKSQPKLTSLFAECRDHAPQCDIYICYIGSNYFQENSIIACAYSLAVHTQIKGYIVLFKCRISFAEHVHTCTRTWPHFIHATCTGQAYNCRSRVSKRFRAPSFSYKPYALHHSSPS